MTILDLIIILSLSFQFSGAEGIHLLQLEPKNGSVRLGDRFRFYLTVGDPPAKGNVLFSRKGSTTAFCTVRQGTQIKNIDGYTCGSEVSEDGTLRYYLQIQNVSLNDSATWFCQVGSNASNNVFLDVKSPPTVQIKPHEPCTGLTSMAGETNLTLNCENVSGNPIPSSFQWYHNLDLVAQKQSYTIKDVTRKSGGLYRCVANNSVAPDGEDSVNVTVHYKPIIKLEKRNYVFKENTYHNITCSADANPPAEITWTKPGIGGVISAPDGILRLKKLTEKESGTYVCTARNTVTRCDRTKRNKTAHMNVTVEVQFPPTVQIKPYEPCPELTFMAGENNLTLDCQVISGNPIPSSFQWYHNLDLVGQEQRYTINRVTRNSVGLYRCVANNSVAPDGEDNVSVTVHYKPTITLKEVDYVFNETTDHNITCTADANPPAEINWTKSGIGAVIPAPGGVLSLKNLKKSDSGTYTCTARNTVTRCDGTNVTKPARMNVTVEVQYAPTITVFDQETNITVEEKEQVKLRCEADSKPAPTLTIQKTKGHNPFIKNQHSEVKNLTFEFTAECNSSGTYVCSARNSLGNKSSREVRVNVKCQPRPANSTKLIYAGVRGNDVNMTVSVISYPKPVFMLQNSSGHVLDRDQDPDYDGYLATGSTTLRISQNSDFGNYSIVVNNTEGEFVFTATIRAQSKPDPPVNLKVSRVTSRSLSLSWEGGFNGGSLQNFTVLYRPEGGKWRRHQTTLLEGDDNHDLDLDISDLEPDTKYQINLSAANTHGSSISSVEAKTKGEITLALYGGAAGGSVMVLIGIIVIVVIVVRRKGKTKDGMQGNDDDEAVIQDNIIYASSSDLHGSPKVDNPAFADEAVMQDNDLYATSGNQNGAAKGDNSNDVYAVVKKVMGKEDSVYAVPQKKKCGKEKEKSMGKGKGKGKGKGNAVKTAKGETTRDGDEYDAYSNVDKENQAVKSGRDSDGLLYTTVDFSSKPTSDVIIGAENSSTVYTTVEFNPKPRQSEEGEKE